MAAFNNSKEKYACLVCKMIPISPISFPCDCGWACKAHLRDHFVTEGKIACTRCLQQFGVSNKFFFKVHIFKVNNKLLWYQDLKLCNGLGKCMKSCKDCLAVHENMSLIFMNG